MPGLLRGIARVAAIAGTATAVSNRVSRRQGKRWAAKDDQETADQQDADQQDADQQQQQQYAPAPAPPQRDAVAQLKELAELKSQGILTDAEFEAQKAKILA